MKNLSFKTILGASLIAASAVAKAFGYVDIAKGLLTVGSAIGVVGLGHKLDKIKKALR